jgi:hypothetical protein
MDALGYEEVLNTVVAERFGHVAEPGVEADERPVQWVMDQLLSSTVWTRRKMIDVVEAHEKGYGVTSYLSALITAEAAQKVAYRLAMVVDFALRKGFTAEETVARLKEEAMDGLLSVDPPRSSGMVSNAAAVDEADAWKIAVRRLNGGW